MSPFTVTEATLARLLLGVDDHLCRRAGLHGASSFVARVLNAPHDLHASILTRPPEPEALALGRLFFTMVFFGAI